MTLTPKQRAALKLAQQWNDWFWASDMGNKFRWVCGRGVLVLLESRGLLEWQGQHAISQWRITEAGKKALE